MLQVYWPSDILGTSTPASPGRTPAAVIGYNLDDAVLVVVNTINCDDIQLFGGHKAVSEKLGLSGVSILGYFNDDGAASSHEKYSFRAENSKIYCEESNIIVYDPPNPTMMQCFSIEPMSISLCDRSSTKLHNRFVELLQQHYDPRTLTLQEQNFKISVALLNTCWIRRKQQLLEFPQMTSNWSEQSFWKKYIDKFFNLFLILFNSYRQFSIQPLSMVLCQTLMILRCCCMQILWILNYKFKSLPNLVDLSATAQQIDLRLQQVCYFPIQYIRTMRKFQSSKISLDSPASLPVDQYPEYIRFYNTLWLIINDVTLGITISAFLIENQGLLVSFFREFILSKVLYKDLKTISIWLMNSPGGVKLNNELSIFFGDLFNWIIEFWKMSLIDPILDYLPLVVYILAFASTFGATLSIAIFSDFISIITFHIYCFYFASARIFNWQISIINSLFRLFCGQKRNVLRKRIDSNNYELDQVLLGTLLFIVLVFLLPTVLAFYGTFTITRLIILISIVFFELIMSCLNHFPIFVLLLRLKDYKRIPGGVIFTHKNGNLNIIIKPMSLIQMFKPYDAVFEKLRDSYFSMKTFKQIITGSPINVQRNRLYQLLYSGLPERPMNNDQVLKEIKEYF